MVAPTRSPLLGAVYIICFLIITRVSADNLAQRLPQLFHARDSAFAGGWPLAAPVCPSGTTQCHQSTMCCPSGTVCHPATSWVCCPDTKNCAPIAKTYPSCADSSWQLFKGEVDYFCCAAGQKGALPDHRKGACVPEDQQLNATQSATQVSQVIISTSILGASSGSVTSGATSVAATTTAGQTTSQTSAAAKTSAFTGSAEQLLVDGPLAMSIGWIGSLLMLLF